MGRDEDLFPPQTSSPSLNLNPCPITVMYGAGNRGRRFEMAPPGDLLTKKAERNRQCRAIGHKMKLRKHKGVQWKKSWLGGGGGVPLVEVGEQCKVCLYHRYPMTPPVLNRRREVIQAVRAARGRWRMVVRKKRERRHGQTVGRGRGNGKAFK